LYEIDEMNAQVSPNNKGKSEYKDMNIMNYLLYELSILPFCVINSHSIKALKLSFDWILQSQNTDMIGRFFESLGLGI